MGLSLLWFVAVLTTPHNITIVGTNRLVYLLDVVDASQHANSSVVEDRQLLSQFVLSWNQRTTHLRLPLSLSRSLQNIN